MIKDAISVDQWLEEKDREAGIYINGVLAESYDAWEIGTILVVSRIERWLGKDSVAKLRVDLVPYKVAK